MSPVLPVQGVVGGLSGLGDGGDLVAVVVAQGDVSRGWVGCVRAGDGELPAERVVAVGALAVPAGGGTVVGVVGPGGGRPAGGGARPVDACWDRGVAGPVPVGV